MDYLLFELDVRLTHVEPAIWRTIEIDGSATLEDLHHAIQVAMGWTNSHLHQFVVDKKHYGMVDVDGSEDLELDDERVAVLDDVLDSIDEFIYEYDFGDGWEHLVTVKRTKSVAQLVDPRCTAGAGACPPEDCGGPVGYRRLLDVLRDPTHADYKETIAWIGKHDPDAFSLPARGQELQAAMTALEIVIEDGVGEMADEPPLRSDLPQKLVEAVMALAPWQRATLASMIASSLATELEEMARAASQRDHKEQRKAKA